MTMPTDAELEILKVLWTKGPSTVREVNEELAVAREIGYTTTLKIMQIMAAKGIVERDENQRTHVYTAILKESDTQKSMTNKLLNSAFGGSASKLVMQALGNSKTTKEELAEIRKYLDNEINKKEGGEK